MEAKTLDIEMSEIQNNEILADCAWFADKHRGKYKTSGAHWSTIIRFPKLYDEAVRLQKLVDIIEEKITCKYKKELDEYWECSECIFVVENGEPKQDGWNYCPKCGNKIMEFIEVKNGSMV